jgi:hypothetical protein
VPGRIVARLGVPIQVLEDLRDRLGEVLAATRADRVPADV